MTASYLSQNMQVFNWLVNGLVNRSVKTMKRVLITVCFRQAHEDAETLRSIVGPLEDEIKSLQDQLRQTRLDQVTCPVYYTGFVQCSTGR